MLYKPIICFENIISKSDIFSKVTLLKIFRYVAVFTFIFPLTESIKNSSPSVNEA